jgi:signal transduction histidine kinase
MSGGERESAAGGAGVPVWMWPAAGFLVLFSISLLVVGELPLWAEASGMWTRLLIEASAYLWAARRADLPGTLKTSLRMLGAATLWSCVVLGFMVFDAVRQQATFSAFIIAGGSSSYIVFCLALLLYPRSSLVPGRLIIAVLDFAVVAAALGVMQWQVASGSAEQANQDRVWLLVYAIAQVAMLSGLGAVINLGRVTPSRRAFWWFVVGLAAYLPVTFLGQVHALTLNESIRRISLVFYYSGVVATLVAAVRLRRDPMTRTPIEASPPWLLGINPLTLVMPIAVGAMLILFLQQGKVGQAIPLAFALGAIALVLIVRVVLTARESARLQRKEREAEERLRHVRSEERVRMLADMHDGFGSQLLSARLLAERGDMGPAQLADLLSECLADLHLVVDSLNAQDDSLAAALADYRHRLQRRLEGHPCQLRWDIRLQGMPPLSTGEVLQVLRVLQEALTNALKHAAARSIALSMAYGPGEGLVMRVTDDGRGLPALPQEGHGLASMQRRAQKLGATLTVGPAPGGTGTSVALRMPVRREAGQA